MVLDLECGHDIGTKVAPFKVQSLRVSFHKSDMVHGRKHRVNCGHSWALVTLVLHLTSISSPVSHISMPWHELEPQLQGRYADNQVILASEE